MGEAATPSAAKRADLPPSRAKQQHGGDDDRDDDQGEADHDHHDGAAAAAILTTAAATAPDDDHGRLLLLLPLLVLPRIEACGQRSVMIAKSSLLFPAWLVRLPRRVGVGAGVAGAAELRQGAGISGRSPSVLAWRAKRDFARLGRAAAAGLSSSSGSGAGAASPGPAPAPCAPFLPKSALDKLARAAPWARPRRQEGGADGDGDAGAKNEYGNGEGDGEGPRGDDPDCNDRWDPRRTKSLRRLDQFLQRVHSLCVLHRRRGEGASELDRLSAAWDEFCRPGDAGNVVPVPFRRREEEEVVGTDVDGGGAAADDDPSRPRALDPATGSDCDTGARSSQDADPDADRRGNDLGQYYCSEGSADRLVRLLLDGSRRRWRGGAGEGGGAEDQPVLPRSFVVLEPTCGDGRLLRKLGEALLHERSEERWIVPTESLAARVRLVGMDMDGRAVGRAAERLRNLAGAAPPACCVVADFLSSRRLECAAAAGLGLSGEAASGPDRAGVICQGQERVAADSDPAFLVIGGPPYTAGAGSTVARPSKGPAMGLGPISACSSSAGRPDHATAQRSLPLRFVRHAIEEYRAEVICFLMPERCRGCPELRELLDRHSYDCATLDCDSLFYFRGRADRPVRQPSVLQCYRKRA
jgi:hypothetical protein